MRSGDSIQNNKQHADVGIELISKEEKAHCVHGCSTEINIVMNGLWIKQITVKGVREREKRNEWAKGIHF